MKNRSVSGVDQEADGAVDLLRRLKTVEQLAHRHPFLLPTQGAGPPPGVGLNGQEYTDTTNKRVYRSDGVGWIIMAEPWQNSTTVATWISSGITAGNSTCSMRFRRSNGDCEFKFQWVFGSTSAVTASFVFLVPYAALFIVDGQLNVGFKSAGGSFGQIGYNSAGTTSVTILAHNTAGTYATFAGLGAAIPFAWTTGAVFNLTGRYEMNNPYS